MINNMKDKNGIETVYVSDRCIILMWEESTNGLTDEDLIELKNQLNKIKDIKKKIGGFNYE